MRLCKKDVINLKEKKWNPNLWKPLGIKNVEVKESIQPRKLNSFLDYQAPEERYVVRGIMPEPPKYPTNE